MPGRSGLDTLSVIANSSFYILSVLSDVVLAWNLQLSSSSGWMRAHNDGKDTYSLRGQRARDRKGDCEKEVFPISLRVKK